MSEIKERSIMLCGSKTCTKKGYPEIEKKLEEALNNKDLTKIVTLEPGTCHRLHMYGPIIIVNPDNVLYIEVTPDDIEEIVEKHLKNNEIVERKLLINPKTGEKVTDFKEAQLVVREIKGKEPS